MEAVKEAVNSIVLDPQYADYLAIIKAARNGAVYGAKVRFPHALVMVFLFRSGTLRSKLRLILKATRQHARNLATFAIVYKTSLLLLRHLPTPPPHAQGKPLILPQEGPYDTFLAGLIGGYAVFGRGIQSSVNQQIVIYVFARVVLALAKISVRRGGWVPRDVREKVEGNAWAVFASLSWGMVMWVHRWHPETIQPSLRSSMKYIYVDSNHWDSLKTLLLYNT